MELIGYTCSYVPVEILSATGYRPYRLLHGTIEFSQAGEKYARIDACPLVRSNLTFVKNNETKFAAIVGTTGCDMARRMFDIIENITAIPTFLVNNPRTEKLEIFCEEIDWLVRELNHLSKRNLTDDALSLEIEKWENYRKQCRSYDSQRAANPSLISTCEFHKALTNYHRGLIDKSIKLSQMQSDQPRVYLLGSPITYEANCILQTLEKEVRIVADFNCGISRFLNIEIHKMNLEGIKRAYYKQAPCIFKRPNHSFYDHVKKQLKKRACIGIIAWTLDYCDSYEFELQRMERIFDLPMLRIRSDLSFQNINQLKTRIAAFKEMLC